MTDKELLYDLLLIWEEQYELGKDVPVCELCREFPEIAGQLEQCIAALKRQNWLVKGNQQPASSQMEGAAELPQDQEVREAARNLAPGMEPVPGYRLIKKIGKGAFGEVWSASSRGKQFAIKFFHGDLNAPEARIRVGRELEGLFRIKKVTHPLILQIVDLVVRDDTLILVTELADLSLEKLFNKIRDKTSMIRRCAYALCLLTNVAEALDHLQVRHHLLHLDIKPANLLLARGVCKIGDFGTVFHFQSKQSPISEVLLSLPSMDDPERIETVRYDSCLFVPWDKAIRRDVTLLTSDGVFTPYYAPPEAFQGKISRSSDQYSLALTFCELVAGQIPFDSEAQLAQRNEGRMELDFLPQPLKAVIGKALAPQAGQRYESCVAFVNALYDALKPMVEVDMRSNNWVGWLLEMENAVGTISPEMRPYTAWGGARWRDMALAGKLLLPILAVLTAGSRLLACVANTVENVFWFFFPPKRSPTIATIVHLAVILLMCLAIVSVLQHWLGGPRLAVNEDRPVDHKKEVVADP